MGLYRIGWSSGINLMINVRVLVALKRFIAKMIEQHQRNKGKEHAKDPHSMVSGFRIKYVVFFFSQGVLRAATKEGTRVRTKSLIMCQYACVSSLS